jgi:hypothetical protein
MTEASGEIDLLIQRLQTKAASPDLRTDYRPSVFDDRVQKLNLFGLFREALRARNELHRVVAANRGGNVPSDLVSQAETIAAEMTTPASSTRPSPAGEASLNATEAQLGITFPPLLRRIYLEVADGGFGPSSGLLSLAALSELHFALQEGGQLPRGFRWPKDLLPLVQESVAVVCIDTSTAEGRMVAWDPEELAEFVSAAQWSRSFKDEAPSLRSWLEKWLAGPAPEDQFQANFGDRIMEQQVELARQSRARIAAMSPAERAAMGLPEFGWERVVWRGLGWDDNQPSTEN